MPSIRVDPGGFAAAEAPVRQWPEGGTTKRELALLTQNLTKMREKYQQLSAIVQRQGERLDLLADTAPKPAAVPATEPKNDYLLRLENLVRDHRVETLDQIERVDRLSALVVALSSQPLRPRRGRWFAFWRKWLLGIY